MRTGSGCLFEIYESLSNYRFVLRKIIRSYLRSFTTELGEGS